MYRYLVKFISTLYIYSRIFDSVSGDAELKYPIFFRSSQDPRHLREAEERFNDDDDPEEENSCPRTHWGEIARQPWDIRGALSLNPVLPPPQFEGPPKLPSLSDCDDDSASVVIKVLFDRDDPCGKAQIFKSTKK